MIHSSEIKIMFDGGMSAEFILNEIAMDFDATRKDHGLLIPVNQLINAGYRSIRSRQARLKPTANRSSPLRSRLRPL